MTIRTDTWFARFAVLVGFGGTILVAMLWLVDSLPSYSESTISRWEVVISVFCSVAEETNCGRMVGASCWMGLQLVVEQCDLK